MYGVTDKARLGRVAKHNGVHSGPVSEFSRQADYIVSVTYVRNIIRLVLRHNRMHKRRQLRMHIRLTASDE